MRDAEDRAKWNHKNRKARTPGFEAYSEDATWTNAWMMMVTLNYPGFPRSAEWLSRIEEEPVFKKVNVPGMLFAAKLLKRFWETEIVMARPLLFYMAGSPPSHAVVMLADIVGVKLDFKELDFLAMEHKSAEFLKINPMGTVPALKDGDFVISESHAIMPYLLEKYGGDKREVLYPSDIHTRALINQCLYFDAGYFFVRQNIAALEIFLEGLTELTPKLIADIEAAYGVVEAYLGNKPYLVGNHLTLADLSVGSTTTHTELILKVDPQKFPRVTAWIARLQKESFFKDINAKSIADFTDLLNNCIEKNKKK